MDALNHVNNAVYFRYFETARLDFFKHVELMEEMAITKVGPVLGDTCVNISDSHLSRHADWLSRPPTFRRSLHYGIRDRQ